MQQALGVTDGAQGEAGGAMVDGSREAGQEMTGPAKAGGGGGGEKAGLPFFQIENLEAPHRDAGVSRVVVVGAGGEAADEAAKLPAAGVATAGGESEGDGGGGAGRGLVTVEIPDIAPIIPLSEKKTSPPPPAAPPAPPPAPEVTVEEKARAEEERKKAEEVKARRAAALSLLLEPPSPGTFAPLSADTPLAPAAEQADMGEDGLGGLRSAKKKGGGASKGLFGDDEGDSAGWLK